MNKSMIAAVLMMITGGAYAAEFGDLAVRAVDIRPAMENSLPVPAVKAGVIPERAACKGLVAQVLSDNLQTVIDNMNKYYQAGTAGEYDVLTAEKDLLEVKIHANPQDYDAFKTLADNVNLRLKITGAQYSNGILSGDVVDLVKAEKQMYGSVCQNMLAKAQKLYNVGMVSSQNVKLVQDTCESLK